VLLCVVVVLAVAPVGARADGDWRSYGRDVANSRSQPRAAGITVASVSRLVERWSRRQAGNVRGTSYSVTGSPAVVGGTAYYTDWTGHLTAVSLRTGRKRWSRKVSTAMATLKQSVASSPTVAGGTVYVSAFEGRVVAVSARTGAIRWSTVLDTNGSTTLYSSPTLAGDRLLVGVASGQNFIRPAPYDFHGSVAALDARTGRIVWQTYTMAPDLAGPGGSVWGTAAIDQRRGIAYIGTGQAYTAPAGDLTDALLALRLGDGSLVWHRQFTVDDVWNAFGGLGGKDYDLGASPNLFRIGGRDAVGVGDKGGRYAALDRDTGETIWGRQLCSGSHLGGIMTTAAVAHGSIWVTCNTMSQAALDVPTHDHNAPYFDWPLDKPPTYSEIFRLAASSGQTIWRQRVNGASLGALTEAGGAVFVTNTDGTFRALDGRSGRVLWTAHPGAPMGGGATVANGTVLIGYGVQFGDLQRDVNPPAAARGGLVAYGLHR
jgi:polyvinyl alcohol dehydrogenase (cytochrome)